MRWLAENSGIIFVAGIVVAFVVVLAWAIRWDVQQKDQDDRTFLECVEKSSSPQICACAVYRRAC